MANKILPFDVALKEINPIRSFDCPKAYTNDLNSVEFQFTLTDMSEAELVGATANVVLYMRDKSFFQNTPATGVTLTGNIVKYVMKENEGNHAGIAQVQVEIVYIDPAKILSSKKYNFEIVNGLEMEVAVEVIIEDWSSLVAGAEEYIAAAESAEAIRIQSEIDRVAAENIRLANDIDRPIYHYVTQAEYDALTIEEQNDPKHIYEVTDSDGEVLDELTGFITGMQTQFDQAISGATVDSETINARVDKSNVVHPTLKVRLDNDKSITEQSLVSLNEQLAEVETELMFTPEQFAGTDVQKLQQALDYAITNNVATIYLNKKYDITGSSIYLPTGDFWGFVTFTGGQITKNDAGFIFDTLGTSMNRNSPIFINTKFTTTSDGVRLFNGDKMIRQNLTNCIFNKVGLVKSSSYLQSVRLKNCETGTLGCNFIEAKMGYDISIDDHKAEQSSAAYQFIKIATANVGDISYYGLRIDKSLFEGYANTHPIEIGTGYGAYINAYFEMNNEHIKIVNPVGTTLTTVKIDRCVFANNQGTYDVNVGSGILTQYIEIENCTSSVPAGKYLCNTDVFKGKRSNNVYGSGKLTPSTAVTLQATTYTYTQISGGATSITFEIPLHLNNYGNDVYNSDDRQFIVNIQGTYGSSTYYKAHLVGILSIDGFYSATAVDVVQALNFTALSTRNTSGNNNGNLANGAVYDYYFKETGTKEISSTADVATVVFSLPNLKYNTKNRLSFAPISRLLGSLAVNN